MGYSIKHTFVLILIGLAVVFSSTSCRTMRKMSNNHKRNKDMREMAREQRKKDKEATKKYQENVKRHAQGQTRKTRREMKKNYRKSERHRTGKKEFFLKRWFTPKHKRTVRPPGL